jgi:predicted N-acetyltransferase YhbS
MADISFGTAEPRDLDVLAELCSRCLGIGLDHFAARLRNDPVFLPGGFLVARDEGRIVATVHACGFELVFGSARVPCGGIGNVSTDPAYRKRGLARRLLDDAHGLMRARGLPVSVLTTGIQDFYRPMGYEVWPHIETHLLKLRPPTGAGPGPRVRRIDFGRDRAALLAVRENYCRGFVGTIAADEGRWSRQPAWTALYPKEDPALALTAEDESGKPVAYLRATADPERTWSKVLEFGAAAGADEAVRTLGRGYLREAFVRGVRGLQFPAPCREIEAALAPFAEATVPVTADYLMLRIADLAGFLRGLSSELSARAAAGKAGAGRAVIVYGDQSALVRAAVGHVEIEPVPPGGDTPRAVLEPAQWVEVFGGVKPFSAQPFARRSTVGEREIVLLDAIFPVRDRVFWDIDAF